MSKYENSNTLYSNKLNTNGTKQSQAKMNKADNHSLRTELNPNADPNLEINNSYLFINKNNELQSFNPEKFENENDADFYNRRMEERKKFKEDIYKKMKEEENKYFQESFGKGKISIKKDINNKKKMSEIGTNLRSKCKNAITKKIDKATSKNETELVKLFENEKLLINEFAELIGKKENFNKENVDRIIKELKSVYEITDGKKIKKSNQNTLDNFQKYFKDFGYLNEGQSYRDGSIKKIRSTEIILKIPDDNNLNIPGNVQQDFLKKFVGKVYPNNNIFYMVSHLDENPENPHTHLKLSGFNNKTNDFDLMNEEIKFLNSYVNKQSSKNYFNEKKDADLKFAQNEIINLNEKLLEATTEETEEIEKILKLLNKEVDHLENYSKIEVPKNADGSLKKWSEYKLDEQKNHGVIFQDILYRSFENEINKKTDLKVNLKKRSLQQKLDDNHNYEDRKSNILERIHNRQNKVNEEIKELEVIKENENKKIVGLKSDVETLENKKEKVRLQGKTIVSAKNSNIEEVNKINEKVFQVSDDDIKRTLKKTRGKQQKLTVNAFDKINDFIENYEELKKPLMVDNEKYKNIPLIKKAWTLEFRKETPEETKDRLVGIVKAFGNIAETQILEQDNLKLTLKNQKYLEHLKSIKAIEKIGGASVHQELEQLQDKIKTMVTAETHNKVVNKLKEVEKVNQEQISFIDNLQNQLSNIKKSFKSVGMYLINSFKNDKQNTINNVENYKDETQDNLFIQDILKQGFGHKYDVIENFYNRTIPYKLRENEADNLIEIENSTLKNQPDINKYNAEIDKEEIEEQAVLKEFNKRKVEQEQALEKQKNKKTKGRSKGLSI
jgi:hypothetical protein